MAKKYHKRARAIADLLNSLSKDLSNSTGYSDKAAVIVASVEIINTLLYTFDFAPKKYKNIDGLLNDEFSKLSDESDINKFAPRVKKLLDELTTKAKKLAKN